jgi:phosphatidylinositol-3-phosphatase
VSSFGETTYALVTLPLRMQEVQTRSCLVALPTRARTGRKLTFQRRLVTLCAWLMLFPERGPLPQISHTHAITETFQSVRTKFLFYWDLPASTTLGLVRYKWKMQWTRLAALILPFLGFGAAAQTMCSGQPDKVPAFEHVLIVVEENQSYEDVIGNPDLAYLNQLAQKAGLARQFYARTHPSINNYFFLTAAKPATRRPAAVADLFDGRVMGPNVAEILMRHGKTWKSYAEGLPSVGYVGGNVGLYAKRHNPFAYYRSVLDDQSQRNNLVPFSQFATDWKAGKLPNYAFLVPNLNNDAHNNPRTNKGAACPDPEAGRQADHWLEENLRPLIESDAFKRDSLLVITFDEGCNRRGRDDPRIGPKRRTGGGGRIPTILVGAHLPAGGCVSDTVYHHESLLRLSLEALGVTETPPGAANAPAMGEFFVLKK